MLEAGVFRFAEHRPRMANSCTPNMNKTRPVKSLSKCVSFHPKSCRCLTSVLQCTQEICIEQLLQDRVLFQNRIHHTWTADRYVSHTDSGALDLNIILSQFIIFIGDTLISMFLRSIWSPSFLHKIVPAPFLQQRERTRERIVCLNTRSVTTLHRC